MFTNVACVPRAAEPQETKTGALLTQPTDDSSSTIFGDPRGSLGMCAVAIYLNGGTSHILTRYVPRVLTMPY